MENRNLTFSGGLILGAGLVYLLHAMRGRGSGAQCAAGTLGVAAVAFGARLIARIARESSASTARDVDTPNYAWLR
ncbi:MAG TPA: hypothetical protein VK527_10255 [Candidatus Limnocylindrales bacterium]|nr:hypothetical protein [Candidatus Limnocylindrales bacterium]